MTATVPNEYVWEVVNKFLSCSCVTSQNIRNFIKNSSGISRYILSFYNVKRETEHLGAKRGQLQKWPKSFFSY